MNSEIMSDTEIREIQKTALKELALIAFAKPILRGHLHKTETGAIVDRHDKIRALHALIKAFDFLCSFFKVLFNFSPF